MKTIDFFCGAGGLTRGLLDVGFDVVAGIDVDEHCSDTFEHNNSQSAFHCRDIRDVDCQFLKSITRIKTFNDALFVGCAPCQPFSQQRKASGRSKNATLLSEFGRLIESCLPRAVIVENVPGMAKVDGFSTFRRFLKTLTDNRYSVQFDVLDAKWFGVSQTRRRLVLLAIRGVDVSMPDAIYGTAQRPVRTVRDAIAHFPPIKAGEVHDTVPNHVAATIAPINLERLRHTPTDGGDRRAWPKRLHLECHSGGYEGHTDVYGRMAWSSPAPTLTAKCNSISNGRYGHPEQHRAISLREAAAIQSFPDRYIFFGSNKHIAQQIGNAVPVRFAECLGRHLLQEMDCPKSRKPKAVRR